MPYFHGAAARRSQPQQQPLAQQLHHESSNPLGVRAENPFLQQPLEQRQPSPFSMTTSEGSSTTTSATDEGFFPSFEIGQDEVVTEVAPTRAQQQHQLSASVADAWVQMADEETRDTQLSFPPQQTTTQRTTNLSTKPSTTLQAPETNNNIFRRTSRTVVDWWQAPCQAPALATQPETAALHWPRRSRRGLGGNTNYLSHGGLIPPNPSGARHRAQRGNDHDREDRCLRPSKPHQQPATAGATARPSHQASRAAAHPCHHERRQDAFVTTTTTTHGSCNKTSHNNGSWKTEPKPNNNTTTTTTQFLPARLRVSLADSPSDRTAPSCGVAAVARPTSSSWRNHPATRSSLNHSNNHKASKPAKSSSSKSKPSNSKSTKNNNSTNKNKNTTMTEAASLWKTAVDPKSGKTYYYHTETRETQWRKPLELASDSERQAMREKEARQRDFFAAMEANILKNLQAGQGPSLEKKKSSRRAMSKAEHNLAEHNNDEDHNSDLDSSDDEYETERGATGPDRPGLLVRTISSFDERILKDLVMRVPSHRRLSSERSLLSDSPTDVAAELETSDKKPSLQDLRGTSEGSLEDMELLGSDSNDSGSNDKNRPGALRGSTRQPSLGTVLATLPEEHEPSMENLEFSFGEQSFADMGLSEQESQALMNFAQVSSEMALMGDESFILHEDEDEDNAEPLNGLAEGSDEDRSEEDVSNDPLELEDDEEEDDPLKNMSMQPTPMASGNNKTMARGVASQRVLPSSSGSIARPKVSRRNTCGTLYVGSTMSAPDVDATIKCVCGVIRAHIVQSEMDPSYRHEFLVFNDQESQQRRPSMVNEKAPSLDQICAFYRDVFRRAQMESDCIIMSLIYVERLIKSTHGKLRPRASNWRSVLFSSMVLASKVWDDLSMWNGDFSQTCPAGVKFTLQRINQLELAVLDALSYKVKVPASEYAKYYFLLRAMLIKSGLGGDAMKELNPLDVDGARRLQAVSSKYQRAASLRMIGNTTGPRSKSLTIEMEGGGGGGKNSLKNSLSNIDFDEEEDRGDPTLSPRGKVSLEHMVQM